MELFLFIVTMSSGGGALYQFDMMQVDFKKDPSKNNMRRYAIGTSLALLFMVAGIALMFTIPSIPVKH